MTPYTDAQKRFLITTHLDGTLLCDIFYRKFKIEMSEESNRQLFKEMKELRIIANPQGWLRKR